MSPSRSNLNALLICDYPVKEFVYKKVAKQNLDGFKLHFANELIEAEGYEPNIVIIDINIMPELEKDLQIRVQQLFPRSHILLMQEDHDRLSITRKTTSNHLFIQLGKRANHSTLEDLLWVLGSQECAETPNEGEVFTLYSVGKCA